MSSNNIIQLIEHELEELQAIDIVILDVAHLTTVTDHMIICTGRSSRHVKSLANNLLGKMKKTGNPAISQSGLDVGEWALIDFNDAVIHIMLANVRDFYNLEGLWDSKPDDLALESNS